MSEERQEETEASTSTSSAEELIPRTGASSVIWNWFGFKKQDTQQSTVLCKICRRTVAAKGSSTTNLFHHLNMKHPKEHEESIKLRESTTARAASAKPKAKQPSIAVAFASAVPYEKTSKRWREITNAVTHHIAKDMVPVQTVERDGFKKLIKTLDPKYVLPSRKYFAQTALPELYTACRERVVDQLKNVEFFSTTTDLWSSRTSEPYLSLTVHYIDNWELCNKCLQTSYFPEDHTGEVIANGLREALSAWNLREDRQVCMTTDSGANVVKALALNRWTRLQCFGHRLHLAIGKFMLKTFVCFLVSSMYSCQQ